MKPSFHEDFSRKDEVKGSTDRSFGLTVGRILLAIAAARTGLHLWHDAPPGWVEGVLAAIGVLLLGIRPGRAGASGAAQSRLDRARPAPVQGGQPGGARHHLSDHDRADRAVHAR